MSTFQITVDATQLHHESPIPHHEQLLLWSGSDHPVGDWFKTEDIQTFQLEPGAYKFQMGSGSFVAFQFTVTPKGVIKYDSSADSFVEGIKTSNLTLKGVKVTFDRRYLTGPILYLIEIYLRSDAIPINTPVTLLPGDYSVIVGSGTRAGFNFTLKGDGTFAYQSKSHECKPDGSGGFLRGGGTSTLEFLGYPILLDARFAAGGDGVGLVDLGLPFVTSAVQFANLLPAPYKVWYNSNGAAATFTLDARGNIILPPEIRPPLIQVKKFHDLTLLVIGPTRG